MPGLSQGSDTRNVRAKKRIGRADDPMKSVKLNGERWEYDPDDPLGPAGGFGEVFRGWDPAGNEVAVKRLHLRANVAAHREMELAAELSDRDLEHVLPVIAAGRDEELDAYFVVMPVATGSLEAEVEASGPFDDSKVAQILLDVALGLDEVGDIVHRDLKPANVLLHQERWKIADFGIARFVEESTSQRTLKDCLSPFYAAPEQWRLERATAATDLYALGCVGYTLRRGDPPFTGSRKAELRKQHLNDPPPKLPDVTPRLRQLLYRLLSKLPNARPPRQRVIRTLRGVAEVGSSNGALSKIGQIAADLALEKARKETKEATLQALETARVNLANEGETWLRQLVDRLMSDLAEEAPMAKQDRRERMLGIKLGAAWLRVHWRNRKEPIPRSLFESKGWDLVTDASVVVKQQEPRYVWSASLWYADLDNGEGYRWYEVSFFENPILKKEGKDEPYGLGPEEAATEAGGMQKHCFAFGPKAIDEEAEEEFRERWANLLARGAQGGLARPSRLPLSENWWRRPPFTDC